MAHFGNDERAHGRQSRWLLLVIGILTGLVVSEVLTELIESYTELRIRQASSASVLLPQGRGTSVWYVTMVERISLRNRVPNR
jgi:hypothetical protein